MAERNVKVTFLGEASSFVRATKQASGAADDMGKKVEATGKRAKDSSALIDSALVGASAGIIKFGRDAVMAAVEGGKSTALLGNAVRNAGEDFAAVQPKVDALSTKYARFGYENDLVEAAVAKLTTSTGSSSKALDLMGVAADLAASRHISLEKAADVVGKVVNGNVGVLGRYGVATKDSEGKTLSAADALDKLRSKYKGASEELAKTPSGKMAALKAEAANLQEEIGGALLPVVSKFVDISTTGLEAIQRGWDAIPGPIKSVITVAGGLTATALAVGKGWKLVADGFSNIRGIVDDVSGVARKVGDRFKSSSDVAVGGMEKLATTSKASTAATVAGAEASAGAIGTIGTSATASSATVSGSMAKADASVAGLGAAARSSATTSTTAFSTVATEADALATRIQEAKTRSSSGTWGGGGLGGATTTGGASTGKGGALPPLAIGAGASLAMSLAASTPDQVLMSHQVAGNKLLELAASDPKAAAAAITKSDLNKQGRQDAVAYAKSVLADKKDEISPDEYKAAATAIGLVESALRGKKKASDDAAGAAKGHTKATKDDTAAAEDNADAAAKAAEKWSNYAKTLHAITDPVFGAIDAQTQLRDSQLKVMKATQDVDKAEREHGRNSDEYRQAVEALTAANDDQVKAALGQQTSLANLQAAYEAGDVSADKMRVTLEGWVRQGLITQGQMDTMMGKLGGLDSARMKLDGTGISMKAELDATQAFNVLTNLRGAINNLGTRIRYDVSAKAQSAATGIVSFFKAQAADGGILGALPRSSSIEPGRGAGLLQWAEGTTGGEAHIFIPLGANKADKAKPVFMETARRLGAFDSTTGLGREMAARVAGGGSSVPVQAFADGGILDGGAGPTFLRLVKLAQSVSRFDYEVREQPFLAGGDFRPFPGMDGVGWWQVAGRTVAVAPHEDAPPFYLGDPTWSRPGASFADMGPALARTGYRAPGADASPGLVERLTRLAEVVASWTYDPRPTSPLLAGSDYRPLAGRNGVGAWHSRQGGTLAVAPHEDAPPFFVGDPVWQRPGGTLADLRNVLADSGYQLPAFARGGRPPVGRDVLVGEDGPEVARFDRPATIYPNGVTPPAAVPVATGAAAGVTLGAGAVQVNVTIDGAVGDARRVAADIASVLPEAIEAALRDPGAALRVGGAAISAIQTVEHHRGTGWRSTTGPRS